MKVRVLQTTNIDSNSPSKASRSLTIVKGAPPAILEWHTSAPALPLSQLHCILVCIAIDDVTPVITKRNGAHSIVVYIHIVSYRKAGSTESPEPLKGIALGWGILAMHLPPTQP